MVNHLSAEARSTGLRCIVHGCFKRRFLELWTARISNSAKQHYIGEAKQRRNKTR